MRELLVGSAGVGGTAGVAGFGSSVVAVFSLPPGVAVAEDPGVAPAGVSAPLFSRGDALGTILPAIVGTRYTS